MGLRRNSVSSWARLSSEMCTVKGLTFALLLMADVGALNYMESH
jgi:hypothetical protein